MEDFKEVMMEFETSSIHSTSIYGGSNGHNDKRNNRHVSWDKVKFNIQNFYDMPEGSEVKSFTLEYTEGNLVQLNLVYRYNGREIKGTIAVSDFDIFFTHEHKDVVKNRYEKMVEDNGGTYPSGLIGGYTYPFITENKETNV